MVATILSRPTGILALAGFAMGAFVLPPKGLGFKMCQFQTSTGFPCPGCGLTRSVTSFLHGYFTQSFGYHPLGFVVALGFLVLGFGTIVPNRWRARLIERLSRYDRVAAWLVIAFGILLLAYGVVRIGLVASGDPDYQWWRQEGPPPFAR